MAQAKKVMNSKAGEAMQEAAKALKDGGRIVNISSEGPRLHFPGATAYLGSKAAIEQYTKGLAQELAHKGVTVNTVSPGWTDTDMFSDSVNRVAKATGRSGADARQALESMSPLGRAVRPDEVAQVVFFLAGAPAAAAITGADYVIDGGETV